MIGLSGNTEYYEDNSMKGYYEDNSVTIAEYRRYERYDGSVLPQ